MDGREGAGARALNAASLFRGWQDATDADNDDITSAELLLEFAYETLLHLVERFEESERDLDHDGLARSRDIDFLGSCNV